MSAPPDPPPPPPSSMPHPTPPPASQPQLLRAHQRDTTQLLRLSSLLSELLRPLLGARALLAHQHWLDLAVRAGYLLLLFGRGQRTLGEEYTDVLPVRAGGGRLSVRRRLMTIFFLLAPSLLVSPPATSSIHGSATSESSPFHKIRQKLSGWLQSPLGQALPEIHMLLFLWGGRYLEFGKRLTGVRYVSTLPHSPPQRPSYEPLALLLLFPLLSRLLRSPPSSSSSFTASVPAPPSTLHPPRSSSARLEASKTEPSLLLPPSPPPTPPLLSAERGGPTAPDPDKPNTYLSPEAQQRAERQCTLCLEPRGTGEGSRGTTAVTECGHVFCWGCLGGLEKPECPLCRQEIRMERVLAAYNL